MKTIIPEELEELFGLFSISAVREVVYKTPQKAQKKTL